MAFNASVLGAGWPVKPDPSSRCCFSIALILFSASHHASGLLGLALVPLASRLSDNTNHKIILILNQCMGYNLKLHQPDCTVKGSHNYATASLVGSL